MDYELIIIGAGPAGYSLACITSKHGLKTLLIEKERAGGICLNVGCIPTKTLINISDTIDELKKTNIIEETEKFIINRQKISQKVQMAADRVSKGVEYLLKTNKVEFIKGEAEFIDKSTVKANGIEYNAEKIVIASGSRNRDISALYRTPVDEGRILTSTEALFFDKEPSSMTILGAGAIGVEFSHIFGNLGWKVNLIEYFPMILPNIDEECSRTLERHLRKKGITVITGAKITGISQDNNDIAVEFESAGKTGRLNSEFILNSTGRTPNTDIRGMEKLGIDTEKGFIKVNENMETSVENIYAIGDVVCNSPLLAHVAYDEARTLAEHLLKFNTPFRINYDLVPYCIYTEPQIAVFGIGENEANARNLNVKVLKSFFKASGKANALEKTEGLIKIIVENENRTIVGAQICGHDATEIIHELLICSRTKIKINEIADTMHAHPTLAELIADTAKSYKGAG